MVRRLVALLTSLIFLHAMTAVACEAVTAQQVADALNNAQGLQSGLKSCSMAAMAMIESGGNTCAHNACCVGILQLNLGPTGLGWSQGAIDAYRNADLQTQVDGWVQTANSNTGSWGYQTLLAAYSANSPIDGYNCPSSDDLRHIAGFRKGGSGSSVIEIMRHAVDAASDGLRLSGA